jgi:OOP family OmpA-OmpF porin
MKKQVLFIFIACGLNTSAQEFNRASFGLSIGGHDGLSRTMHTTRIYQFTHYEANYRYMVSNRVGIKLDAGFDNFKFTDNHPSTTGLRFSIQPQFNLTDLLQLDDFSERFGLQFHMGGGYAALIQNSTTDHMLQGIFGLSPQIKISEKISLNADVSFMVNIRQENGFDFEATPIQGGGFSGYYASATFGFNYYLGKAEKHVDWIYHPRLKTTDLIQTNALQQEIKALQIQMKQIDTVVVHYETRVEVLKGDTIILQVPDTTLADLGIYEVLYANSSSWLNPVYYPMLDKLISYMNNNPALKIEVVGHADAVGEFDLNNKLSEQRAASVMNYLISNDVTRERLVMSFKGKSETKYQGETLEMNAANRRVSFTIIR